MQFRFGGLNGATKQFTFHLQSFGGIKGAPNKLTFVQGAQFSGPQGVPGHGKRIQDLESHLLALEAI